MPEPRDDKGPLSDLAVDARYENSCQRERPVQNKSIVSVVVVKSDVSVAKHLGSPQSVGFDVGLRFPHSPTLVTRVASLVYHFLSPGSEK